jgi:hypothetical protein
VDGYAGGILAADKGFIDQYQPALLAEYQGMHVVTPPRARMTLSDPLCLVRVRTRAHNRRNSWLPVDRAFCCGAYPRTRSVALPVSAHS